MEGREGGREEKKREEEKREEKRGEETACTASRAGSGPTSEGRQRVETRVCALFWTKDAAEDTAVGLRLVCTFWNHFGSSFGRNGYHLCPTPMSVVN